MDHPVTPSTELDRLYDAVALANTLYLKREYGAAKDILYGVVLSAGRLHATMQVLADRAE
jgi:hypothetical protein